MKVHMHTYIHTHTQIKSLNKMLKVSLCYSGTGIVIHSGTAGYSEDE